MINGETVLIYDIHTYIMLQGHVHLSSPTEVYLC